MKYPIGIQTFEDIRDNGYVYVDKTALVYKMVSEGKIYFLSRPRRFGKSLLVSTLRAYFEGRKDLFEGLAIEKLEKDWAEYPVLHFDFNGQNFANEGELEKALNAQLGDYEDKYGIDPINLSFGFRLQRLIEEAHKQTGRRAVVLADDYDKPILSVLETPLAEENRKTLNDLFGSLKGADASLKFAFVTGDTHIVLANEFGGFNHAFDISMNRDYDTLCGITEEELYSVFAEPIRELADEIDITEEEVKEELKKQYDGYHFSSKMRDVYNPFSVLNAFKQKNFGDYWSASGTPTYLVKLLAHANINIKELIEKNYDASMFANYMAYARQLLPMIYQSGYLAIKGYNPMIRSYKLDFPNNEVRAAWRQLIVILANLE